MPTLQETESYPVLRSGSEALDTLSTLINGGKNRETRLLTLVRGAEEPDSRWFMHVPVCFNSALDIRPTVRVGSPKPVWTEGANFAFDAGDTLYDSANGDQRWAETLLKIRLCFHVLKANPVVAATSGAPRHPGSVTFSISRTNNSATALLEVQACTVTQDDFVRLLIVGFPDELPLL